MQSQIHALYPSTSSPLSPQPPTYQLAVNQQILAAIKFGVSQNKVIWQLLNLASPLYTVYDRRRFRMLASTNISENTQFAKFAKYNSKPKFVDLQYKEGVQAMCPGFLIDLPKHVRKGFTMS